MNELIKKLEITKKLEFLNELIDKANKNEGVEETPVHIFDDTKKSINSLLFNPKKAYCEELKKMDEDHDLTCKDLEEKLVKNHQIINNYLNTLNHLDRDLKNQF